MSKYLPILAAFILALGTGVRKASAQAPPFRIGALLCLSGNCADWGTAALRGAQMAVRDTNGMGGVLRRQLELVVEDTRESISGAEAVTAFQKLTAAQGIQLLIGPSWSPGALAVAPLAAKNADVLILTPSASAESFSAAGPNIFNMRPAERLATEALAKYARTKGLNRGAVLTSAQPAESTQGKIFRDAFIKHGGTIDRYMETNPDVLDLRAEVTQVVNANPQVLFLMAYNQMVNALKNLRSLDYKGLVVAISLDESRIAAAGGMLEGVIVAKSQPPAQEFLDRFKREFGQPAGLSAENGYDAIMALAKAIASAGEAKPAAVAEQLRKLEFHGVSGDVSFDENRTVRQNSVLYQVVSGRLVAHVPQ